VGLLDGQIRGLGALEDLVDEDRRAPPDLEEIRSRSSRRCGDGPRGWPCRTSSSTRPAAGKITLLPDYVQAITDREIVLRNYAGETYRYVLPKPDAPPTAG